MLRVLLVLIVLALGSGCDSGTQESQLLFEDLALRSPASGITAISADGTVTRTDADDWRIGPAFASDIRFSFLPSPNPATRGDLVSFQLVSAFSDPLQRLTVQLVTVSPIDGRPDFQTLFDAGCSGGSAACSFTIRAAEIANLNGTGVSRIVVGNGRGIVTYGDIEIR